MRFLGVFAVFMTLISSGFGLDCYTCEDLDGFDGESGTSTCYTPVASGTGATNAVQCSDDTTAVKYYCRTEFTLEDGLTTKVRRSCIGTDADEDSTSTSAIPAQDKCVTTFTPGGNPIDKTVCHLHCTSDRCNSETASSLKTCSSDCSGSAQGHCNYITGQCVCQPNYSGPDCSTRVTTSTVTRRKCVQCNSETDSGCATATATSMSDCPVLTVNLLIGAVNQMYCSSAKTTVFDESGAIVMTVLTRGCTEHFIAVDECEFSDIHTDDGITSSGYSDFTCYSTCDTDGCNTNDPNGILDGSEEVNLECVVCDDDVVSTTTGCGRKTTREACPSDSTYCKSTVTYLVSDVVDRSHNETEPAYKLVKIKRECATEAVTRGCNETSVETLSFKKVVCAETCQEDGCNVGWPARPTCLTCSSTTSELQDGFDTCLENPDGPVMCDFPYHAYCYIKEYGIEENKVAAVPGYTRRIERGCSHYDRGNSCSKTTLRSTVTENCNYTCTTDGCNQGNGAGIPLQTVASVILPAIFGWFAQLYL